MYLNISNDVCVLGGLCDFFWENSSKVLEDLLSIETRKFLREAIGQWSDELWNASENSWTIAKLLNKQENELSTGATSRFRLNYS